MSTQSAERELGDAASELQSTGDVLRNAFRKNIRQSGMLVALAVIVVYFQFATHGTTLKPGNVSNVIQQNGYILILAIGMVIVIIAGHIDLSVGAIAGFVGAISAQLMVNRHMPWGWAIIVCLVVGAIIGSWQGFWIAYIGIPSFIVTLASMLAFRGATLTVLKGTSIGRLPVKFRERTTGFLPGYNFGFGSKLHDLTIVLGIIFTAFAIVTQWRDRRTQVKYGADALPLPWFILKLAAIAAAIMAFTWLLARSNGYPVVLLILAFLLITYGFIMKRTVLGRHVYAVGGNAPAAKLSGVKSQRVTFFVFVNMGVLSALAGLLITARLNSAVATAGTFFELDAIAAAFIGGASASGGVGTVFGAVVGGLVMATIANGLSLTGVEQGRQQMIRGSLLLFAVAFDIYNKKRVGR
jgi:putative multiple sugar transport system permease protein